MKLLNCIVFIIFLLLTSGCLPAPNVNRLIESVPGFEFEEFNYNSATIGNTYTTEVRATNARIEGDALYVEEFTAGNKNTAFSVGVTLKGLKLPKAVGPTSSTGGATPVIEGE